MNIEISEFIEGARNSRGLTVIIDVFRAFSVECYAIDSGAVKIITAGEVADAFELKKKYPKAVLVGERDEKKIKGFDFGNSPTEIIKADLSGKTVIHTTTAGTNGIANASDADSIITGSFVNATAVAKYIRETGPSCVSLIAMGYRAHKSAEEDLLCAEYLEALIRDRTLDIRPRIANLRETSGRRFFRPENIEFSPPTDFFLCTMLNRFNFILKAQKRFDGNFDMEKIDI
ncbi:MAG TPA: 2-phosphosulfolactate phosphatase [Bacteroidales bacterium]|nr:2-phosphosulfolactate phosphatase [Bacteroidales bacterium]HBZ19968.1 2-phosphosulfolactate phosphatase [Bacteroidales bacterium]